MAPFKVTPAEEGKYVTGTSVTFPDVINQKRRRTYDFAAPRFPRTWAADIACGFYHHCAGLQETARRAIYLSTMRFVRYVVKSGFPAHNGDPMLVYLEHLRRSRSKNGRRLTADRCHSVYGAVAGVLRAAKLLNDPKWLRRTDIPFQPYKKSRKFGSPKKILSEKNFRKLEEAAIREVKAACELPASALPGPQHLIPFAVLFVRRCHMNAEPLRLLDRACLNDDINPALEQVVWYKGRSHKRCRIVDTKAPFQAPDLVKRLLRLTEPLIPMVHKVDRDKLFICRTSQYGRPRSEGVIDNGTFRDHLKAFLRRNGLPLCTFGDIRATSMDAHFRKGRRLSETSKASNHETQSETARYLRTEEGARRNDLIVHRAQLRFEGVIIGQRRSNRRNQQRRAPGAKEAVDHEVAKNVQLFGFICANPLEGIAPGSKPGEICPSLFGCFSCTNAMFPNDIPAVARLLQLRNALLNAAPSMPPARWEVVFAPVLRIIDRDILPKLSRDVIEQAGAVTLPPLPDLSYLR